MIYSVTMLLNEVNFDVLSIKLELRTLYKVEHKEGDIVVCSGGTHISFFYNIYTLLFKYSKTHKHPMNFIVNERMKCWNKITICNALDLKIRITIKSPDIHTIIEACSSIINGSPLPHVNSTIVRYHVH